MPVVIALPTGRVRDTCLDIIEGSGMPAKKLRNAGRNLVVDDGDYRYILGKPSDIPTLISQGLADLALVGNDVTEESEVELAELIDTGRGRCFMAIAGPPAIAERFTGQPSPLMGLRVASKYGRTAQRTFESWGAHVKVLHLNGSVELAPALGLVDCIFDIVQTGNTLRANGLVVVRRTAEVSLRLVANLGALQLRWESLRDAVDSVRDFVNGG
jgi:ATP phosphoribosyltransferase